MKTVYLETSILSYLAARPSRDLLAAARQEITRRWWDAHRVQFEVFSSALVEEECRRGDPTAVQRRIDALAGIPVLDILPEAYDLAEALARDCALPESARDDAVHIALAAAHGIDYLLTWNCRHIDNAALKPVIRSTCVVSGYVCPEICTPEELMGGDVDV